MEKLLWPSNWFWYKTIPRSYKINNRQGEHYSTGCLLNYSYMKKHYRLTAVDVSRQKQLDVDSKAIQIIEFIRQLKKLDVNYNATHEAGND